MAGATRARATAADAATAKRSQPTPGTFGRLRVVMAAAPATAATVIAEAGRAGPGH